MFCPFCSWEGKPEEYGKHYDEKHSAPWVSEGPEKQAINLTEINEKISMLLNKINLGFTPKTQSEEIQIRRVILKLTEAAAASREF